MIELRDPSIHFPQAWLDELGHPGVSLPFRGVRN